MTDGVHRLEPEQEVYEVRDRHDGVGVAQREQEAGHGARDPRQKLQRLQKARPEHFLPPPQPSVLPRLHSCQPLGQLMPLAPDRFVQQVGHRHPIPELIAPQCGARPVKLSGEEPLSHIAQSLLFRSGVANADLPAVVRRLQRPCPVQSLEKRPLLLGY